jgi:hypothetical protein
VSDAEVEIVVRDCAEAMLQAQDGSVVFAGEVFFSTRHVAWYEMLLLGVMVLAENNRSCWCVGRSCVVRGASSEFDQEFVDYVTGLMSITLLLEYVPTK